MSNDILAIKSAILDGSVSLPVVLVYDKTQFVANEYSTAIIDICKRRGMTFLKIANIEEYAATEPFSDIPCINLLEVDEFNMKLLKQNLIVICKKVIDIDNAEIPVVYHLPELEKWNIEEYVKAVVPELDESRMKLLCTICTYDINRIKNETLKLSSIESHERSDAFDILVQDGNFNANDNIFSVVDALIDGDCAKIRACYSYDYDALGILTMAMNKLANMAKVVFDHAATPKSLGISQKYFDFMKRKYSGKLNQNKIAELYLKFIYLDEAIKSGVVDKENAFDYILIKRFS